MKTRTAALLAIPVAAVTLGAGAAWAGTQTRSTVQTHDGHAGSISQREQVMTQAQHAHRHAGQARVASSDQVRDRDRDQVRDRDRDRDRDQVRDRDRDQVRDRDRDHVGGTTTGDASGPQAGGQHHGDEH